MVDFFISYNKADRSWAVWVAWWLEKNGYSVIIQEWDFRPGNNFVICMDNALKDANVLISILSPDYLESKYCQAEWSAKLCEDPTGTQRKIIPIMVRQTATIGLLKPRIHIDLVDLDEEQAMEMLLRGVSHERAKPSHPPRFPGTETKSKRPRFPGRLPKIWNVPFLRNNNFTGRVNVLQEIEMSLDPQVSSPHIHAVHGLSGTGKTQLLVEYAYRFSTKYDLVWWIKSESPETLLSNYLELAKNLDMNIVDVREPERKIALIRGWLEAHDNWLLIFDNAKKPEYIANFIPRSATGNVLISSTYPHWKDLCSETPVTTFSRSESLEFIYKRTKQDCIDESDALAESLGDLPLALAQACAYIETKGLLVSEYNSRYQKYQTKLLERSIPRDYPSSLVKTLEMSYQEIEGQSQAATYLLSLCCFFAPNDIPLTLLTESIEPIQEPLKSVLIDELLLDETVERLLNYSLVERKEGSISIHQLVQLILRDHLEEPLKRQICTVALSIVYASCRFDFSDFTNWPKVLRLLPHILVVIKSADSLSLAGVMRSILQNQLGSYFSSIGNYEAATETFKIALDLIESDRGKENPFYATIFINYVLSLRNTKDPATLVAYVGELQKSLEIQTETFGSQNPGVAPAHTALGLVLQDIGGRENLETAKCHFMAAYYLNRDNVGEQPARVLADLNNLAMVLRELGGKENISAARVFIEEALDLDEEFLGSKHPVYAVHLNNYAQILHDLGRIQGQNTLFIAANKKLHEAYEILLENYGDQHPETNIALKSMQTSDAFISKLNLN